MIAARLPFIAVALACAVLGVWLAAASGDEARLERAGDDVTAGRNAQALAELDDLEGDGADRAAALRGYAHLGANRLKRAQAELRAAVQRDPNNWLLQRDYAVVLLRAGERSRAKARMTRALALNPRMALPEGFAP